LLTDVPAQAVNRPGFSNRGGRNSEKKQKTTRPIKDIAIVASIGPTMRTTTFTLVEQQSASAKRHFRSMFL